jgi:hypothetical protein
MMDDEDQYWYCNDLKMSKVELLESKGLIGCLNDSGVTSENFKNITPALRIIHFHPISRRSCEEVSIIMEGSEPSGCLVGLHEVF